MDGVFGTASPGAEQVRRYLVEEISTGRLPTGAKVGSERQLAESLGVSRAVVRQVLAGLADAGMVRRVTGRAGGTFVRRRKVERQPARVETGNATAATETLCAETEVISAELRRATRAEYDSLELPKGSDLVEIVRVRLADEGPLSLERALLPGRFRELAVAPPMGSLLEALRLGFGVQPDRIVEQLDIAHATPMEAVHLGVGVGAPLLSVQRVSRDAAGIPVEYSHDLFRSDRVRVVLSGGEAHAG
ncbi:MAG: GntR family transcriptional regulator [Actinomycetales bacterium]